jgi:nucleotide-binding universal stress UspA family protein
MFRRILLAVENSPYDEAIVSHVRALARSCGASVLVMHVADGFAARNLNTLQLRESEEMRDDREYVERVAHSLVQDGIRAESLLAAGDPALEIREAADREHCDLIAMATHGHRFFKDLFFGSVVSAVRHTTRVPVLLVRGNPAPTPTPTPAPSAPSAPAQ